MLKTLTRGRCWGSALAVALLMTTGAVAADSWVQITPDGSFSVREAAPPQTPQLDVLGYDENGLEVTADVPALGLLQRKTKGGEFVVVTWPDAAPSGNIGAPALPVVRRLFIAPPGATVSATATVGTAAVIDLSAVASGLPVMPRQVPIPKIPGARENAPFDFDPVAYAVDADYLADPVTVTELGIARGQRLFLLEVHPVAYNPVAQTITFRSQIDVSIEFSGGGPASDLNPLPGLDQIVLNPDRNGRSTRGSGNYLIIVSTTYESDIAPFADAKAAQGFAVMTHVVSPSTPNTTIKSYIQDLWGTEDAPEYILLVGDTNTIPHWVGGGSESPSTDLPYACMDGSSDWYPDIAIGRFPGRSPTQMATLVDKTLYYENGPLEDPAYKKRAAFMASVDNYQISEGTHNYVIDTWLAPNGYQCDRLYQVTYGATTQDVRDSFNDGRFYGVYSGHGGTTGWGDGPPFSQADVNNLTNENMYSFICSFACSTGDYVYSECFMETWVLAPNKAAVCSWGSSVSSYWGEDDILERRLFDAIFDNEDDAKTEAGPIYNEAKMRFLEYYGPTGTTRRYFEMYNLLGDPSLPLPSACSDAGTIELDSDRYPCEATVLITVADCGLNTNDNVIDTVEIPVTSDSEPAGETVTLYETDTASAEFEGSIELSKTNAPGVLLVTGGDTVAATYIDADDGQGGYNVEVTATAVIHDLVYDFPLDSDPGWATEGQWAFGQPTGGGSHYRDPTAGHTGANVYGYNLSGDYSNSMPAYYLTTSAIDCSNLLEVELRFWRWLGVERQPFDRATVEVSNDGTNWTVVWANPTESLFDWSWAQMVFDISAVADGEPTVYIRWGMGPTDYSNTYPGWNVDDVEIWATGAGPECLGDLDADGDVDLGDLSILLAHYGMTSGAAYEDGDLDGDGDVDLTDLSELLAVYGTTCP